MRVKIIVISLLFISMIIIPSGFTPRADAYIWPKYDGTLRMPVSLDKITLDPAHPMTYEELSLFFAMYDGLFYIDHNNNVQNNLAQNYEADPSYRRYVIKLNQFVRFHDGSDLTAEDVVTSIEDNLARIGQRAQAYDLISKIQAVDDSTVEFILSRADTEFPRKLAHPFCYITKGTMVEEYTGSIHILHYNGTGPFTVESVSQESFRLSRYDRYHRGRAYLQSIYFQYEPDEQSSFLQFASGRFDIHRIPYSEYSELMNVEGVNRFIKPGNDTIILDFGNRSFREGLIKALKPEGIVNVVMNHAGKGYTGILKSDAEGFVNRSNFTDTRLPSSEVVIGYFGDRFLLEPIANRIAIEWESKGVDTTVIEADDFPCGICDVVLRIAKTMNQDSDFAWRSVRYNLGFTEPLSTEVEIFRIPQIEEQAELIENAHIYPIARPHMAFALSPEVNDFKLIAGCVPDFWSINLD